MPEDAVAPEKVALVCTVLNEAAAIGDLLEAIDAQTRPPDEVIVVDGGSSDGTGAIVEGWASGRRGATFLFAPGSNIASGRNLAVSHASSELIAVTDAGCRPDADWLESLVHALEDPQVDVAMGFYRAEPGGRLERFVSCLNLPDAFEIAPDRFMPSSRSIAFRKEAWERAGRYPEWLDVGEDMYFNFRLLEAGARRVFVPDAAVSWRLHPRFGGFLRQYYRYARGDRIAGMYPGRHAIRFLAYALAVAAVIAAARWPAVLALPATAGGVWMRPVYRRAWRRLPPGERAPAAFALPLFQTAMDLAKMAGYLSGLLARGRRPAPRTAR